MIICLGTDLNLRLTRYFFAVLLLAYFLPAYSLTEPRIYLQVIQNAPLEAHPHQIVTTQVLIRNEHPKPRTFRLQIIAPKGWLVFQNPEVFFSLMPGELIQPTLTLNSNEMIPYGIYPFTIEVIDVDTLEKIAIDTFEVNLTPLEEVPEETITEKNLALETSMYKPGEVATISCFLENPSISQKTFEVTITVPENWNVFPNNSESFSIEPGGFKILPFGIKIPKNALAGDYKIIAKFNGDDANCQEFRVQVVEDLDLRVTLENTLLMFSAEDPYRIQMLCENQGNASLTLRADIRADPFSPCTYDKAPFTIEPGGQVEIPIRVEPCNIQGERKQYLFLKIYDVSCGEILFRQTAVIELLPRGIQNIDQYIRIPAHLRTFVAGQQGEIIVGAEFAGKGVIDPENEREIEFFFRYPTHSTTEIYDTYQVLYFGMWEPEWEIDLGDTVYELSPITERWRYARGAGFYFEQDRWDTGLFYAQGIFKRHHGPKEFAYYFGFKPLHFLRLETNFLYKKCPYVSPSHIVSQQAIANFLPDSTFQIEVARDFNSRHRTDPYGFYGELRGKIGQDSWYYLEKIHAGKDYYGYYSHFDQFATGIDVGFCSRLRGSFSTNQFKQNYKLRRQKRCVSIPHQRQYNGQLNYTFTNGITTALTYLNLRAKDIGRCHEYDFDQYWGGFNFSYSNEKLSFLAITQFGLQNNLLNCRTLGNLQRYQLYGCWRFSDKLSSYLSYETGHTNYYEAKPWRHAFGAGINYFPKPQTWVQLYAQRNQQFIHAHSQNQFSARCRTVLPNKHIVGAVCQYFRNSKFKHLNEYIFMVEYIIPLNLPVGFRKDIGGLDGYLMDNCQNSPISDAIINFNGQRALTDCNGSFSFQGICPGTYPLKTELLPKNMINSLPEPLTIEIAGGRTSQIALQGIFGGKVTGKLTLHEYVNPEGVVENLQDPDHPEPLKLREKEPGVGYRITLDRENSKEIYSSLTSTKGRFYFEGLRPGTWRVTITEGELPEYHNFDRNNFTLEVEEGKEITLPLRILPEIRQIQKLE